MQSPINDVPSVETVRVIIRARPLSGTDELNLQFPGPGELILLPTKESDVSNSASGVLPVLPRSVFLNLT